MDGWMNGLPVEANHVCCINNEEMPSATRKNPKQNKEQYNRIKVERATH